MAALCCVHPNLTCGTWSHVQSLYAPSITFSCVHADLAYRTCSFYGCPFAAALLRLLRMTAWPFDVLGSFWRMVNALVREYIVLYEPCIRKKNRKKCTLYVVYTLH